MSHRITVATLTIFILIGLLIWENHRWGLVRSCAHQGGMWDGAQSKCRLAPVRILIEKNLKRS